MLAHEDNDLLCRVEGAAPMGGLMRRHWLPACVPEEVATPDGDPIEVRLLGQDLVIFRDSEGKLGALDAHCPHRRARLVLGRNENCGLRCLYHGWKFATDGTLLEAASEPPGSRLPETVRARSFPVHEAAGFVWVWLGEDTPPQFQAPPWAPSPDASIAVVKIKVNCNWAQVLEGAIDSAHSSSLHSTDMPASTVSRASATATAWPRPSNDKAPRMNVDVCRWGFRYAAVRTPNRDAETHDYIRATVFIAPIFALIPPNNRYRLAQAIVPIDDVTTMFHFIAWHPEPDRGIGTDEWRRFCAATPGLDLERDWSPIRNSSNRYLQDRAAMRLGDFTGIKGIPAQDIAMWEGMGAIADRSREYVGNSDLAIVHFRRQMVAAANAFRDGNPTILPPPATIASFEGIVAKGTDWRALTEAPSPAATTQAA
jgi:phthalate 4,5-dioxygenase oxygenase subunit